QDADKNTGRDRNVYAEVSFFNGDIPGKFAEERNSLSVMDDKPHHQKNQTDKYQDFAKAHGSPNKMTKYGKLYLIPTVIAEDTASKVIPEQVRDELSSIQHFLAENVRTARRFISSLKIFDSVEALQFTTLNKDTATDELPEMFGPAFEGHPLGILSESGSPGVA